MPHTDGPRRRDFLRTAGVLLTPAAVPAADAAIDRRTLVRRHNPTLRRPDSRSPLSVGNGEFAFTADVTGLQSLAPLCTQSQWGWHSEPIPAGLAPSQLKLEEFDTYGRAVGYATSSGGQAPLFDWLRENPHRLNLARIGLLFENRPLDAADLADVEQTLDLWTGVLDSRFTVRGHPVHVVTLCHPTRDAIAVTVESPALRALAVAFDFPYGSSGITASDWDHPGRHESALIHQGAHSAVVARRLDDDRYFVRLHWTGDGHMSPPDRLRPLLDA